MSLNRAMMRVSAGASAAAREALGKPTYGGAAFAVVGRRNMTSFTERERGEETVYMRREDQRLLHNLLQKEKAAAATGNDGKAELKAILGDHKLPEDVIEKLLAWKSA